MNKPKRFFVEYNCEFIASYKSVRACLNFISRKGLKDDYYNMLRIFDNNGDMYHTITGNKIN